MFNPNERKQVFDILSNAIVAASNGNINMLAELQQANSKEGTDYLLTITPDVALNLLVDDDAMKKGAMKLHKVKLLNKVLADVSRLLLTDSEYKELAIKIGAIPA